MLFYRVEGMLVSFDPQSEDSRMARRELSRKISTKSEDFHHRRKDSNFCFVTDISDGFLTAGMILDSACAAQRLMEAYLKHIDCPVKDITYTEITISGIRQLLERAYHQTFISDEDEIMEACGLDRISGRTSRGIAYGENLLTESSKSQIFNAAKRHLIQQTFEPELERIYTKLPGAKRKGHPVHYLIKADHPDTKSEICRLLLQALYANGRISSKRYTYVDFRPGEKFSTFFYDALYHVSDGGALVVRYLAGDDSEEDCFASGEMDTIERICQVAKKHRNRVLTVFCLPKECKKAQSLFCENLGSIPLVELREDLADSEMAAQYLKMLAREEKISTDKALFSHLEPERLYMATELRNLFDEWYNRKLQTTVFPQYKDLKAARQEVIKATPKGSAFEELQEMVGLTHAKSVIQKALNYYKMQRLYEEKGMLRDHPAMHMVFTGNPGTAKTTAARLFARIMQENGLLSQGHLVEVGRGDLVGKFVGWTAQIVKEKFKQARGGVLFIDEAYSLVDDRGGSFGDEAINTIVQEMENNREETVVIFAGYPGEMEKFLQKNPGLRSRIAFHVPFEDYNAGELLEIARLMGKKKGICFDPEAEERLRQVFEAACRQQDFGNGRYVRNLLEQAKMNLASRLLEYDFEDITAQTLCTVRAEDIVLPELPKKERRAIGFAV